MVNMDVSTWAGMKFRAVKYLNTKLLDISVPGNLLSEAEDVIGAAAESMEAEEQRLALSKSLRHKFTQMRGSFMQKVRTAIMRMRKFDWMRKGCWEGKNQAFSRLHCLWQLWSCLEIVH